MKKIIYFLLCILLFTSMFATSVFAYSPQKAITYSNTYAINPNKMNTLGVGYNVYSTDCTNFVSQCLYAGGLSQDSTWKSIPNWHGNTVVRVDSTQWVNANSLKEYLKTSGRGTKIGSWSLKGSPSPYLTFAYVNDSSNLSSSRTGKVVLFYDWESDGTMNHSAFFVANNGKSTLSGEGYGDLINQHTENRKQVLWRPDNRQNSTQKATTRVYAFEIKA